MKKFTHYINESKDKFGLRSMDDDFLQDRLESLIIHRDEIQDEIEHINKIIKQRKEISDGKLSENLPQSIFELNKDQLDFIFEHGHGTSKKRYEVSRKYFSQLDGVIDTGSNPQTSQFYFSLSMSMLIDDNAEYDISDNVIKSIEFLGENLKKNDGYVKFGCSFKYSENDYNSSIHFINKNDIKIVSRYDEIKFKSVKSLLEYLVEEDISQKSEGDW